MVYLSWRLGKPPCTVHIFIPTILLLALFRKEERAFFAQKQELRFFSSTKYAGHASCAAIRPVRAAPFPAPIVWCTRTAQAVRPYRTVGFSLNLSWSAPPTAAGTCRAPRRGQEGRHQGFYPLNSHFLLGGSGADCRHVTAAKRSTAEDFFFRVFRNLFAVPDTVLLHIRFTLRRARHKVNCPKGKRGSPGG